MKYWLILLAVFAGALLYRFVYFPGNIYFGFDQARDAYVSRQWIGDRSIKLLGPPTDISGVFQGPLYYYLIGPFYALSRGDPQLPFAALMVLNAGGVFLVYLIGSLLFGKKAGLLAALFYAFSFEQYQYSYYAANPSPAMISVLIFYLGCLLFFLKNKPWGLVLLAAGLGTAIHFEFFLIYLAIIPPVNLFLYHKTVEINRKWLLISLLVFGGTIGNYLLAEIKYPLRMTVSLLKFFASSGQELYRVSDHLTVILEKYFQHIYLNLFGFSLFFSALVFFLLLYLALKEQRYRREMLFLLVWVAGPLVLYFANIATLGYFMTNIGVAIPLTLLTVFLMLKLIRNKAVLTLLIILILLGNIKLLLSQGRNGLVWGLLAVQNGMMLRDERAVVDYTYREAAGEKFQIKTLSMPLKIQTTWAYLYRQYGKSYGYFPAFSWGNNPQFPGSLPEGAEGTCRRYVIAEPQRGIAGWFVSEFYDGENRESNLISEKRFGQFTVQKRVAYGCTEKN